MRVIINAENIVNRVINAIRYINVRYVFAIHINVLKQLIVIYAIRHEDDINIA